MPAFSPYPERRADPTIARRQPSRQLTTPPVAQVPTTSTSKSAFVPEAATPRRPKLRLLADFMTKQGQRIGKELGLETQGVGVSAEKPPSHNFAIPDLPNYGRPMRPTPLPPPPGRKPNTGSTLTSPWAEQYGAETGFSFPDAARSVGNVIEGMGGRLPAGDPSLAPNAPVGAGMPTAFTRTSPGPLSPSGTALPVDPSLLSLEQPPPGVTPDMLPPPGSLGRDRPVPGTPSDPNAYPPGAFAQPVGGPAVSGVPVAAGQLPTPGAPEGATDPIQMIAQTSTMQQLNEDPVATMEAEGLDIEKLYSELMEEIGSKEPEGLNKEDKSRLLVEFGFSLMAAGGQPGASFLGSVGAAGLNTLKSYRGLKRERRETAQAEAEERRDIMGMAVDINSAAQTRGITREQMQTQMQVAQVAANSTIEAANIRAGASKQGQLPANAAMIEYMVSEKIVDDSPEGRRQALDEIRSGKLNVGTLATRLIPGLMEKHFDATPDEIGKMAADAAFAFAEQYDKRTTPSAAGEPELVMDTEAGVPVWKYPDGRTEPYEGTGG